MRTLALVVALTPALAWASGPYTDGATAEWFRSLAVPGVVINCCDQSDCHRVRSEWRGGQDGDWWAETVDYPGEWVKVPKDHIVKQANPLQDAVLCSVGEDAPRNYNPSFAVKTSGGHMDSIYCFVPPPNGF